MYTFYMVLIYKDLRVIENRALKSIISPLDLFPTFALSKERKSPFLGIFLMIPVVICLVSEGFQWIDDGIWSPIFLQNISGDIIEKTSFVQNTVILVAVYDTSKLCLKYTSEYIASAMKKECFSKMLPEVLDESLNVCGSDWFDHKKGLCRYILRHHFLCQFDDFRSFCYLIEIWKPFFVFSNP